MITVQRPEINPNILQGLHYPEEGDLLERLAREVPAGQAIVEIGSFRGVSTLRLAKGALEGKGAHVTCIDPWPDPHPKERDMEHAERQRDALILFQRNMAANEWPVTALRAHSYDVLPFWIQPIGLLFIDGAHHYAAVLEDMQWTQHIAASGIVVVHDCYDMNNSEAETDVFRAILSRFEQDEEWRPLEPVKTMWIGQKGWPE